MKKLILAIALVVVTTTLSVAQKVAYVDSDHILSKLPEYAAAQQQIDALAVQWQKEIEAKYMEIDKLYKSFQAEQILLTEEMKKKRENEIIGKEKEVKDIQKKRFGVEGDLFQKRQELVKPLQDKVYNAIQEIATKEKIGIVFDKSSGLTMLFTDPKLDKSAKVLEALGVKD